MKGHAGKRKTKIKLLNEKQIKRRRGKKKSRKAEKNRRKITVRYLGEQKNEDN